MADEGDAGLRYPAIRPPDISADEWEPAERTALDAINRMVAGAESLERIVDFLFETTRDIFPCDRISVAFIEEEGHRVRSYYTVADYAPIHLKSGYAEDLADSSLEQVIERGAPRIIGDLEAYARAHPDSKSTRLILSEGVRSNLTCPLAVDGRKVGLLFRSSRRPNSYGDREVRLHLAVAERLAQAVEKAYRIEQLEAANTAYTEMLGFVSHELKAPIASLVSNAELVAGGYLGELNDRQRERLERMMARGRHLLRMVGEYLDLARVEGRDLEPGFRLVEDFGDAVIGPALETAGRVIEENEMRVERDLPESPLAVECDPDLLRIVMTNLLTNAAKYGRRGGSIRVRANPGPDVLEVGVFNEGPGFSPESRAKLFRKFSRLDEPELKKKDGTGVGLYTCWRLIRAHGGTITADSEPGKWAEFSFRIPQPPG